MDKGGIEMNWKQALNLTLLILNTIAGIYFCYLAYEHQQVINRAIEEALINPRFNPEPYIVYYTTMRNIDFCVIAINFLASALNLRSLLKHKT